LRIQPKEHTTELGTTPRELLAFKFGNKTQGNGRKDCCATTLLALKETKLQLDMIARERDRLEEQSKRIKKICPEYLGL